MRVIGFCGTLFVFVLASASSNDVPAEAKENTILLLFKDVTIKTWNDAGKTALFQAAVSNSVNGFCAKIPDKCSLNFWNETRKFLTRHVVIAEAFPQQQDNNLAVELYVLLPEGSDIRKDGHTVVPETTLKEAVQAWRGNITSVVGVEIDSIASNNAESDKNGTADNMMNYIMIPISFAVLVILCVVACCYHLAHKKREKAIDIERRKHVKLRGNVAPKPPSPKSDDRLALANPSGHATTQEQTRRKKRKKHLDRNEGSYADCNEEVQSENNKMTRKLTTRKTKPKHKSKKHRKHRSLEEHSESEDSTREDDPEQPVNANTNEKVKDEFEGHKRKSKRKNKARQRSSEEHSESEDSAPLTGRGNVPEPVNVNTNEKIKDKFEGHKSKSKKRGKARHRSSEEHSESGDSSSLPGRGNAPEPMNLNTNEKVKDEFEGQKRKSKKRNRARHPRLREQDEGYAEGSESRQTGVSEDSLIKSLPHPRQLPPLQAINQNIEV